MAVSEKNAPVSLTSSADGLRPERRSRWLETLISLLSNRSALLGLIIIIFLALIALFAPIIAPYDPIVSLLDMPDINTEAYGGSLRNYEPCIRLLGCDGPQHLMGLDQNSRDLFSRIVYGARTSLFVGIGVVTFAITVGSLIGMVAGYMGSWVDNVIMRVMDVMLAFPSLLLAISIVTIRGPGLQNALLAIGIVSIPIYARLARASVLTLKEQEFVVAERALGAGHVRIVLRHILPNALTPLSVQGTLGIGTAVIEAAGLAFLGLGAQPPQPEWGFMLSESRNLVFTFPHLVFFPGIAITITVLGFNLLGDGLRDVFDPRLRGSS